ncbi:MAG TPA: S41 family peptidase [Solirubrobacter sp.]|nr:S41 family peptidase [Solirubrobacter sp.]
MRPRFRLPRGVLAVLIPLALVLGIWIGGHPAVLPGFARDALVADTDGRLYEQAIDALERDYFRPVDRKKLLNTSLTAAVDSLQDQFSHYFSPTEYTNFQLDTQGKFEGVGMTVTTVKQGLRVEQVYEGSPADEGGLKEGDVIVSVNGRSLAGKTSEQSTALIKGPAGTAVTLGVRSDGRTREVKLRRAKVDIPIVQSEMKRAEGEKLAWVRLAGFTSGSGEDVKRAVEEKLKAGAEGVVLDLRHNGGGLLNEAVAVASVFIPDGKIVSTKGRARPERVYNATGGAIPRDIPVAVLVDGASASASEIVTGALQDRKRATVVGTRTYGKGVFQEIEQLSNGGALDITVGEYFLPSGRNLGGGGVRKGAGVTPDVKASDDPKTKRDEALQEALETVAGG